MPLTENENTSGSGETASAPHWTVSDLQEGSARRCAIDDWQKRLAKFQRDNPNPIVRAWRDEANRIYRLKREAEGRTVRPYVRHDHVPWIRGETHESHERRLHRDRARSKRGVDDATVRPWTDLSLLSEEEKAAHRRKLAVNRKARQRKRAAQQVKRQSQKTSDGGIGHDDIEWGMF
jgi:hypothetical protein